MTRLFTDDAPDAFDGELPRRFGKLLGLLRHVFRHRVYGLHNVPDGPALLVFNHGAAGVDALLFAHVVHAERDRWIRFLGDRALFEIPPLARWLHRWGSVEGGHYQARRRLQAGDLVGVFPGGAREAWKPHREARTLRWDGRRGFARLALKTGVPVVPVACPRADDVLRVQNDGFRTAERFFENPRFPLPIALGPFPVRLVHHVGEPIRATVEAGETADQAAERLADRTRRQLRALLDGGA